MTNLCKTVELLLPGIRARGGDVDLQINYATDSIELRLPGKPPVTMLTSEELATGHWQKEWRSRLDRALGGEA